MSPPRSLGLLALVLAVGMTGGAVVPDGGAGGHRHAEGRLSCSGRGLLEVIRGIPELCVHGSEPPPAGVDTHRRPDTDDLRRRRYGQPGVAAEVQEDAGQAAGGVPVPVPVVAARGWSVACVGNGRSGRRVQLVYAHAADVRNRLPRVRGLLAQYAADADQQIATAARQAGAGRRVRFVTNRGSRPCSPEITRVQLSRRGDDSFQNTIRELRAKGLDRTDRKYLVWVDAAVGICGLGQIYNDDRPGTANFNNTGPMYARVDTPCWGTSEDHELLHTLGAVQRSAPNATAAGHCTDTNDTMCYKDAGSTRLRRVCRKATDRQVDCRRNDYFNANPGRRSYLGRHWNTADSDWLIARKPPPKPPSVSLQTPKRVLAGRPQRVRARVSVPRGRTHRVSWTTTRQNCRFTRPSRASTGFYCPATTGGATQVTVRVRDSKGMTATRSARIRLRTPDRRRPTRLRLDSTPRLAALGGPATVTGRLTDRRTRRPIAGMPVTLHEHRAGRWRKLATTRTDSAGRVRLGVRPPITTTYMLTSAATPTWRVARSNQARTRIP